MRPSWCLGHTPDQPLRSSGGGPEAATLFKDSPMMVAVGEPGCRPAGAPHQLLHLGLPESSGPPWLQSEASSWLPVQEGPPAPVHVGHSSPEGFILRSQAAQTSYQMALFCFPCFWVMRSTEL